MTAEHVALVAPSPLGAPAELALARLSAALQQRGWTCRRERDIPAAGDAALVIVAAIASADLGRLTHELGLSPSVVGPGTSDFGLPESLAIRPLPPQGGRPATVLLLGGDDRGLSYALLESARRVELEGPVPGAGPAALLDCFPPTTESPSPQSQVPSPKSQVPGLNAPPSHSSNSMVQRTRQAGCDWFLP